MEALSSPLNENVMVDQKMMSLRWVLGTRLAPVNAVADPNRAQQTRPRPIRMIVGAQNPIAPRLCSHLPMLRPATLRPTAIASPMREKTMKYGALFPACCQEGPP